MTHHIELTVTCDQADLDKLLALLGNWSFDTANRAFSTQERGRVHTFLVDGKPMWDRAEEYAAITRLPLGSEERNRRVRAVQDE